MNSVPLHSPCPYHPEDGEHECLPSEMRCAYCGARIDPYPAHCCGKFLTASEMHEGVTRHIEAGHECPSSSARTTE
jgi:hypothetical protein